MKREKTALELQLEIMKKIAAMIGEDMDEFKAAVARSDFETLANLRGQEKMRERIYDMVFELSIMVEE